MRFSTTQGVSSANEVNSLSDLTEEELVDYYLSLGDQDRSSKFLDTFRAAKLVGLSQRTIQLWIEVGAIQAIRVGRKYQIYLHSLKEYLVRSSSA